jgi:hypothetical protein
MIAMSTTDRTEGRTGGEPGSASRPRYIGHGAVLFAVGSPGDRIAAEVKIGVTRIAARPPAGVWDERADFFGDGGAWVGAGGCRRWLDEEGGGRPGPAATVCPGGDGGLLDLRNRHHARGEEAKHDADPIRNAAVAVLPTSDAPRADAEQLSGAVRCDAERAERRAEFGRVRFFRLESAQGAPQRKAGWQRSRTAILALK